MMIRKLMLVFGVCAFAALGCGGEAALGEECGEAGAEEGECEEGSVCGDPGDDGDVLECLKVCVDHADCAADEDCNGIEGTSTKGCRPKTK